MFLLDRDVGALGDWCKCGRWSGVIDLHHRCRVGNGSFVWFGGLVLQMCRHKFLPSEIRRLQGYPHLSMTSRLWLRGIYKVGYFKEFLRRDYDILQHFWLFQRRSCLYQPCTGHITRQCVNQFHGIICKSILSNS